MRFQTTPAFESDFRGLSPDEKRLFREAVRKFNEACDRFVATSGAARWPSSLRVKKVEGAPGVRKVTWSVSGPDGRMMWEWLTVPKGAKTYPAVLWRRVGTHEIFRDP